jgi:hypothetical protein
MTAAELLDTLADPQNRRRVQDLLGLPSEPVAQALADLTAEVGRLAAAQARTDASVKELAAAQARTDASVKELAGEVKALAREVKELAHEGKETRRAVGALSDNVGFGLEELAAIVLPGVLALEAGVRVGQFERRFVRTEQGEEEVDLWGAAERGGHAVVVAGEVKSRIYRGEVERFAKKAARLAATTGEPLVPVLFGFVVHPSAREAAASLGVHVVASRPGG